MKGTKLLFCLTILLWAVCSAGAQNAAKNWAFGNRARIDFNSGSAVASALPVNTLDTTGGSASISDSNGNLLFYTDGVTVWNKNNLVMPHGTGLQGNKSSTQSALIVPCSCNKYFIFTTGLWSSANGLKYSVVDMTAESGLGDITALKNIPLIAPAAEKIAAIGDGNGGYWLMAHDSRANATGLPGNRFFAYHLLRGSSDCTVNQTAVVSAVGTTYVGGTHRYGPGQMKISPDGQLLAVAGYDNTTSFIELFQFNAATGAVTDLPGSPRRALLGKRAYGIEFSPNSSYLYVGTHAGNGNAIYRYDVSVDPLSAEWGFQYGTNNRQVPGSLQLAPDGKIYIAKNGALSLDVITNPDEPDKTLLNVASFPLAGGSGSTYGLPSMVAGDFACSNVTLPGGGCACDQVTQMPFWNPDLSFAWKALSIYNVKAPASDITSIDIDIRNDNNEQPLNPWAGGGLKVNGSTLPVPAWWKSPYTKIPNGTNGETEIHATPNFNSPAVNLNIGLEYTVSFTGRITLIFRHADQTSCQWISEEWTPEPPPQLRIRTNERYLGDLRDAFLPLALGFSDGVNIKSNAKWVAVEPMDADTQVFSVDGDLWLESEVPVNRQLVIASARKQDRAALYELARPVNLERSAGGEIKLVLKRQPGNPLKPRLRFIFFDENANIIGFATNEDSK